MNSEEGNLYFGAGLDNSQLQHDAQEATNILSDIGSKAEEQSHNIKKLLSDVPTVNIDVITNASTALDSIDAAFAEIDRVVDTNKAAIKELDVEYARLSKEMAAAYKGGNDDEYRRLKKEADAVRENISLRKAINREAASTADELQTLEAAMRKEAEEAEESARKHNTLKQEIRELEKAMADYRMQNGTDQTAEYQAMAQRLGELRDIRGDIQRQGSIFSNDEGQIAGVMSGVQGLTGAFTAAQGAVSLFAGKNEDLQRVMLKVQSLMAITMGLQQAANALNKDSAFRLVTINSLKEFWNKLTKEATTVQTAETAATAAQAAAEGTEAAAETANTAAKKANTAAQVENTGATGANAAAQGVQTASAVAGTAANLTLAGAFRAVGLAIKSIPVFGWIVAGISAIIAIVSKLIEVEKEASKTANEFKEKASEAASEPIVKYEMLRNEWERVKGDVNRLNKFIRDHADEMKTLGIRINDAKDAEKVFGSQSNAIIAALNARAKAAAAAAMAVDTYKQILEAKAKGETDNRDFRILEENYRYFLGMQKKFAEEAEAGFQGIGVAAAGSLGEATEQVNNQLQNYLSAFKNRAGQSIDDLLNYVNERRNGRTVTTTNRPSEEQVQAYRGAQIDSFKWMYKQTHGTDIPERADWDAFVEQLNRDTEQWIAQNTTVTSTLKKEARSVDEVTASVSALQEAYNAANSAADRERIGTLLKSEQQTLESMNRSRNTKDPKPDNGKKDEDQRLAEEAAQRSQQIALYGNKVALQVRESELAIRQAQIEAMDDGFEKERKQIELNYDRLVLENEKRQQSMLEALTNQRMLEWKQQNPKATKLQEIEYRATLNVDYSDLEQEQRDILDSYTQIANDYLTKANKDALNKMLADVLTYEQQRTKVMEEYDRKRKDLYETDDKGNYKLDAGGNKRMRQGVTQGNLEELNRQQQEALNAIDEQFAQREASYQAWCEEIGNLSLRQLEAVLAQAEQALADLEKQGNATDAALSQARAKVQKAKTEVQKKKEKDNLNPGKRTIKEWEDLYKTLQECGKEFEEIGDTVGGVAGEIIKTVGGVMTSTLSMINGIVQLVNTSSTAMTGTATAAAAAMQVVEKASVILTVISAALSIATQIANLFNNDDEKQEEIEHLQNRIDQLQWELDNQDIVRLQENTGKAIDRVNQALKETYLELIRTKLAVGDNTGAWMLFFSTVSNNQELLLKSAKKIADAYAEIAYSADKALGEERYARSRQDLENIAQQQLLIQQQINEEEDKKHTDHDQIDEWKRKIEELGKEAVAIINEMVEDIIGGTSNEIAEQLADAFFEAFEAGEDAAEAWGKKVNEIVGDIMKRMLVQKFLEERLGDVFDKYKKQWFTNGQFNGLDSVINSMSGFATDLKNVGTEFSAIWDNLPDSVKDMFTVTADVTREAQEKGIATASQESVDELNGRATTIQSHTYSIAENTKLLLQTTNLILQSVLKIEGNTEGVSGRMEKMEGDLKELKDTVSDIALRGIKIK